MGRACRSLKPSQSSGSPSTSSPRPLHSLFHYPHARFLYISWTRTRQPHKEYLSPFVSQHSLILLQFHSFKMGGGAPPQSLHTFARHSHGRSRSRNNSISLPSPATESPALIPNASLSARPASHHHRRSSVSTRRESAELMGVSLPELPPAHSDDNINLGDKDSIRRRALWALEGKPDLAFSKVEIPDIPSSDTTNPFEFRTYHLPLFSINA